MKIEQLKNYLENAYEDQFCFVFESFEDFKKSFESNFPQLKSFCKTHKKYSYSDNFPYVFKFITNDEQAREFVKKAIEAGEQNYITIQQYAEENGYKDAYEILSGQADDFSRFDYADYGLGYLIDMCEV